MSGLSPAGEAFIEGFEQLSLVAYLDVKGVPTIGWGHTGPSVTLGMTCTMEQAEQWFMEDSQVAVNGVNGCIEMPCTQNQFDALVSLAFNIGIHNFESSTLVKRFNQDDVKGAAAEFPKWDHVTIDGVLTVVAGLQRRRLAEQALFLKPDAV